jgi:hypothetical protein
MTMITHHIASGTNLVTKNDTAGEVKNMLNSCSASR